MARPAMTISYADDGYRQDLIAPLRVEHRLEFGDRCADDADGAPVFGHSYNFIVYEFREGGHVAEAEFDIDDGRAILRVLDPADFDGDFASHVLVFLSMRAQRVAIVIDDRVVGLDERPAFAARVSARKDAHMRAVAD